MIDAETFVGVGIMVNFFNKNLHFKFNFSCCNKSLLVTTINTNNLL